MSASDTHAEWAKTLAEKIVQSGEVPPTDINDEQRLALAWALKARAYSAWSLRPSDVAVVAKALSSLSQTTGENREHVEILAVASWISGIADIISGRMTTAAERFDNAREQFLAMGMSSLSAQTQIPKVMALSILGLHSDAIKCAAMTRQELVDLGELQAAAKVSGNLGNLLCQCSRYREALPYFSEAVKHFDQVDDRDSAVGCRIGIAEVYAAVGDFEKAMSTYSVVMRQAKKYRLPARLSVATEAIALVHLARGEYKRALGGLESARQQYAALVMPQNAAVIEKQLADVYLDLRLLPEALSLFDVAIARFDALEMPVEQAWALTQRGRAHAALGRSSELVHESLGRAWDLFTTLGVSAGRATVLLARAELALTEQVGTGGPALSAALANDASVAFTESGLTTGKAQADVVRAYALLQCADLNAATTVLASTLDTARTVQLLSIDVRCQVGLGLVAKARGDVHAAKAAFESAIVTSEEQRSALPGDDLRSAFLVDQLRPYEELLRFALNGSDADASADAAASVLVQLERFRARALGERLGEFKAQEGAITAERKDDVHGTEQTATTKHESELRAQLRWLYRRRQKLLDDGDDAQAVTEDSRRVERELLEAARRRRLTTVPVTQTPVYGLTGDMARFDVAALQSALGEGEALVEYGVIDDELFACVVTNERISLHRQLAKWPDVLQAISTARFQIESCRNGAGIMAHHLPLLAKRVQNALQRTHALIWAPLSERLAECSRALIVPHEQLGALPFAALYDGEAYVAQHMNVAMVASARVALFGVSHPPLRARRVVALGESSRLVHAGTEAQFVAGLFEKADVLIGPSGDAASLRAFGADADVLHLACHAEFRSDNPMFSALHLADGPFTVQDAETLRLPQGVVVLSACETGVSEYSRGDEMIGLVRAFLVAGAARVVASLWPVDDAVTQEFMAAFYPALRAGNSPAVALRAAQMAVMETHPHPFHWAAFTLYGGW